jgi:hypothetical protein
MYNFNDLWSIGWCFECRGSKRLGNIHWWRYLRECDARIKAAVFFENTPYFTKEERAIRFAHCKLEMIECCIDQLLFFFTLGHCMETFQTVKHIRFRG